MSRLPRPIVPPPLPPIARPPEPPVVVIDTARHAAPAARSLSFFHVASGVLCLCLAVAVGLGVYYVVRVTSAVSDWSAKTARDHAELEPQARLLALATLRPHGVVRIASECVVFEAEGVVTFAGACERKDMSISDFACRWRVAKFGNERRWSLLSAELDEKLLSP